MPDSRVAEIELTVQELANAVAERVSHTRLTPAHRWNSYTLEIKIHDGELAGATVRYYLDTAEPAESAAEIGRQPPPAESAT